jgi:hypothetical protein
MMDHILRVLLPNNYDGALHHFLNVNGTAILEKAFVIKGVLPGLVMTKKPLSIAVACPHSVL